MIENQRKIRERLQREWPQCFTVCPVCPPAGLCAQCIGTGRVTVATAHLLSEGVEIKEAA